ncbi:hypothetical protein GCM10022206_65090 [Streptomyces chiangmaiensis]
MGESAETSCGRRRGEHRRPFGGDEGPVPSGGSGPSAVYAGPYRPLSTRYRSLKEPGSAYDDDLCGKDPQPAHMDGYVRTGGDDGGVHINCGIPNHSFYLLATTLGGYA